MKRAKKGYIVPNLGEGSELIAVLVAFDIPSGNDQMPIFRQILRRFEYFMAPLAVIKATEITNLQNFA